MGFGLMFFHLGVGAYDDEVSGFDKVGGCAVDANYAAAALAFYGVCGQAGAVGDVQYVDLFIWQDAGAFHQVDIYGDRAFVVQVSLCDCGPV